MRRAAPWMVYLGTAGAVLGLSKIHAATVGDYDFTSSRRLAWAVLLIALHCVAAYAAGLPDAAGRRRLAVGAAVGATAAASVAISLVQLVQGSALLPRYVVLGAALVLAPWYVLCAALSRGGAAREGRRERVVAVVGEDEAVALERDIAMEPERRASVVAVVALAEACAVPGSPSPLRDLALAHAATLVVLDRAAQSEESVVHQVAQLHESGVRVRTLSLFYDEWLGKLPVSELERVSLMFDIGEIHRHVYFRVKRLTDVVSGLLGCVALAPLLPFVILGNALANRGPLFFRQERVGKQARTFTIYKLRTMRPDAAGGPGTWTAADDPRITPFGRVLRRTHLDELPQAWNIVRGDLALVGPRPEQPHYVEELAEKIPFYRLRHLVRPGLTGWAQVKYGYAGSESDAIEKLQYEFFYLRHQSLTFDLRILARTLRSVLGGSGR